MLREMTAVELAEWRAYARFLEVTQDGPVHGRDDEDLPTGEDGVPLLPDYLFE